MIFLDAYVFLRSLVHPESAEDERQQRLAIGLLGAIAEGEVATTSEAVLAEVAFVLNSKRQYGLEPTEVVDRLQPILVLPALLLPRGRKRLYLRAFELWSEHPGLGFVDALTAATVEGTRVRLATFDSDFDDLPRIRRWQPATET